MIEDHAVSATTERVVEELRARPGFVMVSHVKPDGDTLGAGLALGLALERLGKPVWYFQQDAVPRNLRFLPGVDKVTRTLPNDLPERTLFVFCDMSQPSRAGNLLPAIARENVLDVDHHLGNDHFGGTNYVLPTECSTGTVVMRLLRELGVTIDEAIATCILTTIMTDTGGLMHSNTTPEALELAADLMRLGADKERITREVFGNKRAAATKLLGQIIGAMQFGHDGKYCYSVVDDRMLRDCGADGEDTEDTVNVLLGQEGVEAAALFKAYGGELRVSLRSTGRVNVQAVAAKLGGGGHFRAAGLDFRGTAPEAVAAVDRALVEQGL